LKKNDSNDYACPVDYAFKRIGGKYKGRIIWHISCNDNRIRYGELRRKLVKITPKMLTQALRELEADELIHREVFNQVPPKVEYSLTETGKELMPFVIHLKEWADKQIAKLS